MRLWLDVEDLFRYAERHARPSGIQRVCIRIYVELHGILGDRVRFCRHDQASDTLRAVPWHAVGSVIEHFDAAEAGGKPDDSAGLDPAGGRGLVRVLRQLKSRVPNAIREPLSQALFSQRVAVSAQRDAFRYGGRAFRSLPTLVGAPAPDAGRAHQPGPRLEGEDIREAAQPGDVLGVLGSPWDQDDYGSFVSRMTAGKTLRLAVLLYDIIPLTHPEWCVSSLVRAFRDCFAGLAPQADMLFTISHASAQEVQKWAARANIPIAQPVRTLPMGTGITPSPGPAPAPPAELPAGSYVLFVSTIEARKNHHLAFRVWRRLCEELPLEQVPTLVFAGRVGWLVDDLLQQLANCDYLGGKVVIVADPRDSELEALYRGCRFALFPSLYEGWGLPVTEALSFGKLCIASNTSSVPEAGGPFCLYVDPENISSAAEVVRSACTDDALVSDWEAKIRAGFRPTPWRATAETLLRELGFGPSLLEPELHQGAPHPDPDWRTQVHPS